MIRVKRKFIFGEHPGSVVTFDENNGGGFDVLYDHMGEGELIATTLDTEEVRELVKFLDEWLEGQ